MNVLYLTIFISLLLALFFVAGFLYHCLRGSGDANRDSLLPFDDSRANVSKSQNHKK